MSVPESAIEQLAYEIEPLATRERSALKREFMTGYGVSSSTISRRLRAVGLRSHDRKDRGMARTKVDAQLLRRIAALQRKSLSVRKGVIMPIADAIQIAEDSGWVKPGLLKSDFVNNWLRTQEASRREQANAEPHIELRSLGPNHVHQLDFSLAVNWKMFQGKPVYEKYVYKNKPPQKGEPRLWRAIVTDHATGAYFVHYIAAKGESQTMAIETLYHAWSRKKLHGQDISAKYPFRGVPHILMVDRGPGNRAQGMTGLMDRLGVKLNICEGARSKGQVESSHNVWENHFESKFRLSPPQSIDELNEWAIDYATYRNSLPFARIKGSRSEIWAWHIGRHKETKLWELEVSLEDFKSISLTEPERRRVNGNRSIAFKSKRYRLPEELPIDSYVVVQYSPFYYPSIQVKAADVPDARVWHFEPIEFDEFNFPTDAALIGKEFKAHKKTETRRFTDDIDELGDELVAQGELKVFGHHAAKVGELQASNDDEALPVEGVEAAGVELTYDLYNARLEVRGRIGRRLSAAEKAYLADVFGKTVTGTQIDAAVAAIEKGVEAKVLVFSSGEKQ